MQRIIDDDRYIFPLTPVGEINYSNNMLFGNVSDDIFFSFRVCEFNSSIGGCSHPLLIGDNAYITTASG